MQYWYIHLQCINGEEIPDEWKSAYIISRHKKGNKLESNNYRRLSVTSTVRYTGRIIQTQREAEYKHQEKESRKRKARRLSRKQVIHR